MSPYSSWPPTGSRFAVAERGSGTMDAAQRAQSEDVGWRSLAGCQRDEQLAARLWNVAVGEPPNQEVLRQWVIVRDGGPRAGEPIDLVVGDPAEPRDLGYPGLQRLDRR